MAEGKVDLAALQAEYANMEKMFNNWGSDLNEAMDRASRIAAAKDADVGPNLGAYHKRTLELFDRTLARMQELHEKMVQAGVDTLKR